MNTEELDPPASIVKMCPYRGVHPFSKEDYAYFAGRSDEIEAVISHLSHCKLTIFYGESGCGKTSLIQAGVLPQLEERENRIVVVVFRGWQSPDFQRNLREEILRALLGVINRMRAGNSSPSGEEAAAGKMIELSVFKERFRVALGLGEDELYSEEGLPFERFIIQCCAVFSGRIFFIFDQFEEYLYYHPEGSTGAEFDDAFARAVNLGSKVPANFLLSLRDDGLGKVDRLRGGIPDLLRNVHRLEHLTRRGAVEAIQRPLQVHAELGNQRVVIDDPLQQRLLEQIREDKIGFDDVYLPPRESPPSEESLRYKALSLQIILTRLWDKAMSKAETQAEGDNAGIVIGLEAFESLAADKLDGESEARYIVRTYFDDLMAKLGAWQDDAAEVLRFLIRTGGQKKAGSPRRLAIDSGLGVERVESLLEAMAMEGRDVHGQPTNLLRKVPDSEPPMYEFVHDVMGLALRDWCDRRRDQVSQRRQREELEAAEQRKSEALLAAKMASEAERNKILAGAVLVFALLSVGVLTFIWVKKNAETEKAALLKFQAAIEDARTHLKLSNREVFDPNMALLRAIDAVAEKRSSQMAIPMQESAGPPRHLYVLSVAREFVANGWIAEADLTKKDDIEAIVIERFRVNSGSDTAVEDKELLDAMASMEYAYRKYAVGGWEAGVTDEIIAGVDMAEKGEMENATRTVGKILKNIDLDESSAGLIIESIMKRRREMIAINEAYRFIEEGNRLAGGGDRNGALKAFKAAVQAHPPLKLDPQAEVDNLLDPDGYIKQIEKGNEAAAAKNREEAIKAYNKAIELSPNLAESLSPEKEYERISGESTISGSSIVPISESQ